MIKIYEIFSALYGLRIVTLGTLDKIFSSRYIEIFSLIFRKKTTKKKKKKNKQDLTFYAPLL